MGIVDYFENARKDMNKQSAERMAKKSVATKSAPQYYNFVSGGVQAPRNYGTLPPKNVLPTLMQSPAQPLSYERYGINPSTFDTKAFKGWAERYGYMQGLTGKDEGVWVANTRAKQIAPETDMQRLWLLATTNERNKEKNRGAALLMSAFGSAPGYMKGAEKAESAQLRTMQGIDLPEDYKRPTEYAAELQQKHPVVSFAGGLASSVAMMSALGGVVGGTLSNVPKFAQLAPAMQKALSSGITFGGMKALRAAGNSTWSKKEFEAIEKQKAEMAAEMGGEYIPKEYGSHIAQNATEIILGSVISGVSGYLGSMAGDKFAQVLLDKFSDKFGYGVAYVLSGMGEGLTFAASITAADEVQNMMKATGEGVRYKPDWGQIAVSFGTAAVMSGLRSYMGYRRVSGQMNADTDPKAYRYKYFTKEEINDPKLANKAFRKMGMKYHPDQNPNDPSAGAVFRELNNEYQLIKQLHAEQAAAAIQRDVQQGKNPEQSVKAGAEIIQTMAADKALIPYEAVTPPVPQQMSQGDVNSANRLKEALQGQVDVVRGKKEGATLPNLSPGKNVRDIAGNIQNETYTIPKIPTPSEVYTDATGNPLPQSKYPTAIKKHMLKLFRGKVMQIGDDHKVYINKEGIEEFSFPVRRLEQDIKNAKYAAGASLKETLKPAMFLLNLPDDGRHAKATGGWDNFYVMFDTDSGIYSGIVKTMITDKGRVV